MKVHRQHRFCNPLGNTAMRRMGLMVVENTDGRQADRRKSVCDVPRRTSGIGHGGTHTQRRGGGVLRWHKSSRAMPGGKIGASKSSSCFTLSLSPENVASPKFFED